MSAWYNSLSELQRIFALIAIPSTVVMLIQSVLILFGVGDGDADADGVDLDFDDADGGTEPGDGFALFTVRGFVAMLCVGGWLGIVLLDAGMSVLEATVLAFAGGIAALFGMAFLVRLLLKLQQTGNLELSNAVGKTGTVYLTIPANMSGTGKVHLTVQETYSEFGAMTPDAEEIKTGEAVKVVKVDDSGLLVVKRIVSEKQNEHRLIGQ
ncbi:MAG: hypothetical protein ACOYID_00175 [Eubacteriales bacterium]|jgi:membrane protein implicated in regulation of membrane protease activity|nr:hypothetical protein [Clostridiales bacterium]